MNKESKTYNVADIQRYLQGGMSNTEMRQLEIAALNDPFLQDAIDGYTEACATHKPDVIEKALQAVETFVPAPVEKKKEAVIIPIWRKKLVQYAVASAVVVGTGWFIFNLSQPETVVNGAKESMQNVTAVTTDTGAAPAAVTNVPQFRKAAPAQQVTATTEAPQKKSDKRNDAETAKDKAGVNEESFATAKNQEIVLNQYDSTREDVADATVSEAPLTTSESKITSRSAPVSSLQRTSPAVTNNSNKRATISGKVVDKEKYPLDNITLRVKGSNRAVVSDELGRFEIVLPDSGAILVASGPGYKSKEFKATDPDQLKELEMEPAAASLSETVVIGYARKRSTSAQLDMDTSDASPVGGWKNFEAYILENKKLKRTGKNPIRVILSFEVDRNGRPGEFDIVQSASVAFDNEAIRLLKAGPAWKNKTTETTAMAKITIVF